VTREEQLERALRMFCDGPPGKGFRTDGWATDEHRYCGYCGAKSAWGDTPLAHYNKCAFVVARALLGLRR